MSSDISPVYSEPGCISLSTNAMKVKQAFDYMTLFSSNLANFGGQV